MSLCFCYTIGTFYTSKVFVNCGWKLEVDQRLDISLYIPLLKHPGLDLCKVLPAVHMLTGCDYTSKVGTKPPALKADPVNYLQNFGCSNLGPTDDEILKAEAYLVEVFKNGTSCTTMNELRDHLYYHLKAHILRAYYGTYVLTTIQSDNRTMLNPLSYGYVEEDELLLPDMAFKCVPEEYAVQLLWMLDLLEMWDRQMCVSKERSAMLPVL